MNTTETGPQPIDWGDTYELFWAKIWHYLYRRTGDEELAEDLAAEVFMRAMASTDEESEQEVHLSGWLFRIAHNRLIDYYRWKKRHPEPTPIDDLFDLYDPCQNPEEEYERKVESENTRDAVDRYLTASQKKVIILRFWEGLSFEEIGNEVGRNSRAVMALQRRAVEKLCWMVTGEGYKPQPRLTGCLPEVEETLQVHGPMTVMQIVEATGESPERVSSALVVGRQRDIFCVVDSAKGLRNKVVHVYGLHGLHDQEAA